MNGLQRLLLHVVKSAVPLEPLTKEDLISSLKNRCVIRGSSESLVSSSGRPLQWLIDTRLVLLDPTTADSIAYHMWETVRTLYPCQLACMELTGIPLMTAIQCRAFRDGYQLNGVVIRRERKAYGRQRQIEGEVNSLPIVFVDDIMNSGGNLRKAVQVLNNHDRTISNVVAMINYESDDAAQYLTSQGIGLADIVRLSELGLTISRHGASPLPSIFAPKWKFSYSVGPITDVVPQSEPVSGAGIVYFCGRGTCTALDEQTGSVIWRLTREIASPRGIRATPLLHGNNLFLADYDGSLACLDSDSGKEKWRFDQADWIGSSPCVASSVSSIVVGLEYAASGMKGSIICLDLATGRKRWETPTAAFVHGSPLFIPALGSIVVGTNDGTLLCLDVANGKTKWSFQSNSAIKAKAAYVEAEALVIVGCFDNVVRAINVYSGASVWQVQTKGTVYSEPLVISDYVYVTCTDKTLYVVETRTGRVVVKVCADGKLFGAPSLLGEYVYFGSTSGRVYKYSPLNQALVGIHEMPERITTRIITSPATGSFYIVTSDDTLYAMNEIAIDYTIAPVRVQSLP